MRKLNIAIIMFALSFTIDSCGQSSIINTKEENVMKKSELKMKVEIWSDVVCSFCYIGKRKYETAIQQFADSNNIELVWRSFQLDPSANTKTQKSEGYQFAAEYKGYSQEFAVTQLNKVKQIASEVGLTYNFDEIYAVNTFNSHRIIQFAKTKGLGDEAEETFLKAYLVESKDLNSIETLIELGKQIGLTKEEVNEALTKEVYASKVREDIQVAQKIGITGVPFFLIDGKVAISGAQSPSVYLETIQNSYAEWKLENPDMRIKEINGQVCTPDGVCK
jgi:predicted DsbA family dithiol-disulfide isomerase